MTTSTDRSATCRRRDVVINTSRQLESREILGAVEDGHNSDDELPGGEPSRTLREDLWWLEGRNKEIKEMEYRS